MADIDAERPRYLRSLPHSRVHELYYAVAGFRRLFAPPEREREHSRRARV